MAYETLLLDRADGITTLTLNRPEALNAMTVTMGRELTEALTELATDQETRVLIVTGSGRAFCAGEDVKERPADSPEQRARRTAIGKLQRGPRGQAFFAEVLRGMTQPTVAAINGPAVGQGLSLALACDLRVAAANARLGAIWVKRGIPPESSGAYLLAQAVGPAKALELTFTGRIVGAEEAGAIGLVNQVVPEGQALDAARALAREIAANAPVAIGMAKLMTYQALETPLQVHGRFDFLGQDYCFNTEDREEGIRSFLEKRPPRFTGR